MLYVVQSLKERINRDGLFTIKKKEYRWLLFKETPVHRPFSLAVERQTWSRGLQKNRKKGKERCVQGVLSPSWYRSWIGGSVRSLFGAGYLLALSLVQQWLCCLRGTLDFCCPFRVSNWGQSGILGLKQVLPSSGIPIGAGNSTQKAKDDSNLISCLSWKNFHADNSSVQGKIYLRVRKVFCHRGGRGLQGKKDWIKWWNSVFYALSQSNEGQIRLWKGKERNSKWV